MDIVKLLFANRESIFINVLSNFIFVTIGFLIGAYPRLSSLFRLRRLAKVWGENGKVSIFSGSKKLSDQDGIYIRSGDFNATTELFGFLKSVIRKIDAEILYFETAGTFSFSHDSNMILIGGPNNNEITKRVIDELRKANLVPFTFGNYFFQFDGVNKFELETTSDGQIIKDYAIVLKRKNPFNINKYVMVIFGLKSFGTLAATRLLTQETVYKNKVLMNYSDEFCFIVGAHVSNNNLLAYCIDHIAS